MCDCKERTEQAVKTINNTVNRVLIFNRYEGYELMNQNQYRIPRPEYPGGSDDRLWRSEYDRP